jgi:hypothetical protein
MVVKSVGDSGFACIETISCDGFLEYADEWLSAGLAMEGVVRGTMKPANGTESAGSSF